MKKKSSKTELCLSIQFGWYHSGDAACCLILLHESSEKEKKMSKKRMRESLLAIRFIGFDIDLELHSKHNSPF